MTAGGSTERGRAPERPPSPTADMPTPPDGTPRAAPDTPTPPDGMRAAPLDPARAEPGGALAAALVALREAAATARFALDIPGAEGARDSGAELVRPARRLRAAPPAPPRRPAARGRRRLDRRRQVDAGEQPRRAPVSPAGVLRPTTRSPVLVCHPDDARGSPTTGSCPADPPSGRARPAPIRGPPRRTTAARSGRATVAHAGARPARRPRHRLRGRGQPGARRPAAGRRRPVAVRHDGRALRRRGAVGPPADRRASAAPRVAVVLDRVPPSAGDEIARPPARDARAHGLAARRCSSCPRRLLEAGLLPEPAVAPLRDWLRALAADAAGPRGRRPADARRRARQPGARAAGSPRRRSAAGRGGGGAARRRRRGVREALADGRRGRAGRHAAARRGAGALAGVRGHRRVPARRCRPGSAGCATGSRRRHRAAAAGAELTAALESGVVALVALPRSGPPSGPRRRGGRAGRCGAAGRRRPGSTGSRPTCATASNGWSATGRARVLDLVRARGRGEAHDGPGRSPTASTPSGWS